MKTSVLLLTTALPALAGTTFDNTEKYAWGANTGWISFRHDRPDSPAGITFGGAFLSGYAYSANLGWINFGDGTPTNGYSYSNTTGSDHGVNHDGAGNLTGFAWSANTGWINFGWAHHHPHATLPHRILQRPRHRRCMDRLRSRHLRTRCRSHHHQDHHLPRESEKVLPRRRRHAGSLKAEDWKIEVQPAHPPGQRYPEESPVS